MKGPVMEKMVKNVTFSAVFFIHGVICGPTKKKTAAF